MDVDRPVGVEKTALKRSLSEIFLGPSGTSTYGMSTKGLLRTWEVPSSAKEEVGSRTRNGRCGMRGIQTTSYLPVKRSNVQGGKGVAERSSASGTNETIHSDGQLCRTQ